MALRRARHQEVNHAPADQHCSERLATGQAGEVIVSRPAMCSAGSGRRFRVEVDGKDVADLEHGHAVRLWLAAGEHAIRARCWPMRSATLIFEVLPQHTVRVVTSLSALREVEVSLDDRAAPDRCRLTAVERAAR